MRLLSLDPQAWYPHGGKNRSESRVFFFSTPYLASGGYGEDLFWAGVAYGRYDHGVFMSISNQQVSK